MRGCSGVWVAKSAQFLPGSLPHVYRQPVFSEGPCHSPGSCWALESDSTRPLTLGAQGGQGSDTATVSGSKGVVDAGRGWEGLAQPEGQVSQRRGPLSWVLKLRKGGLGAPSRETSACKGLEAWTVHCPLRGQRGRLMSRRCGWKMAGAGKR